MSFNVLHVLDRLFTNQCHRHWKCITLRHNSKQIVRQLRRSFSQNVRSEASKTWNSVVGLEVHAQILADSKLFSGSGTSFMAAVNDQVGFFDAALPGTLPVINKRCVEAAVMTALALQCRVNQVSEFDRKHYFYADLPNGYQITQQRRALANDGCLSFPIINVAEPYVHESKILQLQLEQDSGKSIHCDDRNLSLVDLNRAGTALMEIVFDADLSNGEEAAALVDELRRLLTSIGTCDGKMEEGSMRVDANVSIHKPGDPWGIRTEIKNISSMRSVAKAIDYEIMRQIDLVESGGEVENETRMYDAKLKATVPMRDKEAKQDYRFMPEPNLPPLRLRKTGDSSAYASISEIATRLPSHLPSQIRKKLLEKYDLKLVEIEQIIDQGFYSLFTELMNLGKFGLRTIFNFLTLDINRLLNEHNIPLANCPISVNVMVEIMELHASKQITNTNKNELLEILFTSENRSVQEILIDKNWTIVKDIAKIEKICKEIFEATPKKKIKKEKDKLKYMKTLKGLVYEKMDGQVDMAIVKDVLLKLIDDDGK